VNLIKKRFHLIIFFLSCLSLFYGFYQNEDGTGGGAAGDFASTYGFILALQDNILSNPKDYTLVHTPFHFIILSFFENFFNSQRSLRLFYCTLSILLPTLFYYSLVLLENKKSKNLLILSSVIFIMPAFRYTSIWATDLITSLIFFQISIIFFLRWSSNKSDYLDKNIFLQIIFLALATYCRQYFAVFFIFFLIQYFKSLTYRNFIFLFFICVCTSVPVLYYTYLFPALITEQHISLNSLRFFLLGNSSMMSIYFLPIFLINIIFKKIRYDQNFIISVFLSFLLTLFLIFLFRPDPSWLGGGVVYQLSLKLLNNYFLFFLSSFFSFFMIIYLSLENKNNFIILFIALLVFFSFQVYQRYYEPMIYLIIFSLIQSKLNNIFLERVSACIILFLYYLVYYIGAVTDLIYKI